MDRTLALLSLLASCSSAPARLHLLEPVKTSESSSASVAHQGSVGIRRVQLPEPVRDSQLLEEVEAGQLQRIEGHEWGAQPTRSVSALLAEYLGRHGSAPVLVEPWPRTFEPQTVVRVQFDSFHGQRGGTFESRGHFSVEAESRDGEEQLKIESFHLSVAVEGDGVSDLMRAKAVLLAQLAKRLSNALASIDGIPQTARIDGLGRE